MFGISKSGEKYINPLLTNRAKLRSELFIGPKLKLLLSYWEGLNRYTIYALIIITPFFAGVPPKQMGFAAAYSAVVIFITLLFPTKYMDFLQHFILTIGACVLLAAINLHNLTIHILGNSYSVQFLYNWAYVGLFISSLLHLLVTFRKNYLQVTSTDFLLVIVPLLLVLVPEPWNSKYQLSTISLRGLILFMGMRTLVKRHFFVLRRIKVTLLIALIYILSVSLLQLRFVYG